MLVPNSYLQWSQNRHATWYGLPVSDTDFGDFLSDTAVLHFDTDFSKIYGDIIFTNIISLYASQNYSTLEYSFIVSD